MIRYNTSRVMSDAEMNAAEQLAEARLTEAQTPSGAPLRGEILNERVRNFMHRPYRMEVHGNDDEGYLAAAPELPGCMTAGETPEAALRSLRDAMATWLEATIIAGGPIPEPDEDRYSGRMLLRLPKSLHARLAGQAGRENVSINQLALTLLAEGLGREQSGLLTDVKHALDISHLSPGPDRELRRFVREIIRTLADDAPWDPTLDAPGSTHTALATAFLSFWGSLPSEVRQKIQRRITSMASFELRSAATGPPSSTDDLL